MTTYRVQACETQVIRPNGNVRSLAFGDAEGEVKLWIITTTTGEYFEFAVPVDADIDQYPA